MKIKQYSYSLSIEYYDALILECGIMQQYVDHSYFDYAVVDDEELRQLDEDASLLPAPVSGKAELAREKLIGMKCTFGPMKKNCGGVIQPFPGKVSVCRGMLLGCCSCCCCLRSSCCRPPHPNTTNNCAVSLYLFRHSSHILPNLNSTHACQYSYYYLASYSTY